MRGPIDRLRITIPYGSVSPFMLYNPAMPRSPFKTITLVLSLLFCRPAYPQGNQATISGTIVDVQGAVVAGASVTAVDIATGARFPARTNDSGFFSIPNLPVGVYSVTIEHQGFRRYVRERVTLSTGDVLALDARLEL